MERQYMEKLTKSQAVSRAKKLKDGELMTVTICPSNMRPNSIWYQGYEFSINNRVEVSTSDGQSETLEQTLNSFSYYNCNPEMGKRIHWYV
jgi:hypothetical protein